MIFSAALRAQGKGLVTGCVAALSFLAGVLLVAPFRHNEQGPPAGSPARPGGTAAFPYPAPASPLSTPQELTQALTRIAENPDHGQRRLALIQRIKALSADDCKALLKDPPSTEIHRLLAARWMDLDPVGLMAAFPKGDYLDLLAIRDPARAGAWTRQYLAGADQDEVSDTLDRLAEGLSRRDPALALQEIVAIHGKVTSDDSMFDAVAARGTSYTLQWFRNLEQHDVRFFFSNPIYYLAEWEPDELLQQLKEPQNAGILRDSRIAIAAGLVSQNPARALEFLKPESGEMDPRQATWVAQELLPPRRHGTWDQARQWAQTLPQDDPAYDEARITVANDIPYAQGVEIALSILGPQRSATFHELLQGWQKENPDQAAEWMARNASRIPPAPPPAPESSSGDDNHNGTPPDDGQ